jgi:hypothetical protein
VAADRRVAARKSQSPAEPWRWDHPWNESETFDINLRQAAWGLAGCSLMLGILGPLNYLAWAEHLPWFVLAAIGLFDCLALLGAATIAYRLLAQLRHGRGRLQFAEFPLCLGREARLTLHTALPLDDGAGNRAARQASR